MKSKPKSRVVVRFSKSRSTVPLSRVLDFMSQVWVAQRDTVELYQVASERVDSSDLVRDLRKFQRQDERHLELLETAIRDLGGNPVYISPEAQVQQQRGADLLRLIVPDDFATIVNTENLLAAEMKNLSNWEFLRSVTLAIEDPHARDILQEICDEIIGEQQEHHFWLEQIHSRLMVQRILRPPSAGRRAA